MPLAPQPNGCESESRRSRAFDTLRVDDSARTPGAWLIPIAIMIVMSFPPVRLSISRGGFRSHLCDQLFGHEFVALFCGDVWGLWVGFAIVAAGTIVGELATYLSAVHRPSLST